VPVSKDALPTRIIIRSIFGEANWCGPFVRNQQLAKRVAGPLRVIIDRHIQRQCLPMSVLPPIATVLLRCTGPQYSSASMIVITRSVTLGSEGSGECANKKRTHQLEEFNCKMGGINKCAALFRKRK